MRSRALTFLIVVSHASALSTSGGGITMRRIDLTNGKELLVAEPAKDVDAEDAEVAKILGIDIDTVAAQRSALDQFDNAVGQKLWPASVAFARMLTGSLVGTVQGCRVIEVGAGLGLVGVAAALAGAESVTLTDYQPKSLELAKVTAEANGVSDIVKTQLLDWTDPGDLKSLGAFDVVLGSDVLYDKELSQVLVTDVIAPLLLSHPRDRSRPEPRAMLVDPPNRPSRGVLPEACASCGLYWGGELPVAEAEDRDTVAINILRG